MKNQDLGNANNLALKVTDLHKQFGTESVLKVVYLEAAVGDVISMLDASDSGKSTFVRVGRWLNGCYYLAYEGFITAMLSYIGLVFLINCDLRFWEQCWLGHLCPREE